MSHANSGVAVPGARQAFYRWSTEHEAACWSCWHEGVIWSIRAGRALSPHLQVLFEFVHGLERRDQVDRAYDWALSNANAEEHAIRADDNEQEELPF